MQYVHDAQLIIGGLEDKLKVLEHDAATQKNICAQCKAKMKTTKLDALAPPELTGMADELKMTAQEYAVIFQPWTRFSPRSLTTSILTIMSNITQLKGKKMQRCGHVRRSFTTISPMSSYRFLIINGSRLR